MSPRPALPVERRLLDSAALAALVLAGHALGGGTASGAGLALLGLVVALVLGLARLLPARSRGADLALLLIAQAAGHLALALGDAGAGQLPAWRMLAGHVVATAAVAALALHGRTSWAGARRLLARALVRWRVLLPALPVAPGSSRLPEAEDRPVPGARFREAVVRRGPPAGGCTAYA